MSLLRQPSQPDRPEHGRAAEPAVEHKIVRERISRLGRGSFACPECDLPLLPSTPVLVSTAVECPFCSEIRPARHFLRLDAVDTTRNEVYVRARLPVR